MLVVVERGEEFLKSKFLHGWVNYMLVVDKSALEMKIYLLIADNNSSCNRFRTDGISVIERGTCWGVRS